MLFNETGSEEKHGDKKRKEEKKKYSGNFDEIDFNWFLPVMPSNFTDPLKIHNYYEFE